MKKDMLSAPFITEMRKTCRLMYEKGWDERNGGNISYLLNEKEVSEYIDTSSPIRNISFECPKKEMAGKLILVTGTGKYFKNVYDVPERDLGILKIAEDGKSYSVLWGFSDGCNPTSELASHLLSHAERLKADKNHRVLLHCHATNIVAMTFITALTDRNFSRILWKMITECVIVFPEGVGVLPWMVCGKEEIGIETAKKMKDYRMVIWGQHGIFGAGSSFDEAFGLIETAEKAAEIYMKIAHLPIKQTIEDDGLREVSKAYNVTPREDFLT